MTHSHRLAGANFAVAIAAFGLAALLGLVQALTIAGIELPGVTPDIYYLSVTAHGVLMALVFTTFFIMGLGYLIARERLGFLVGEKLAWFGFWLAVIGTAGAAFIILSGKATVLYTFYPPLEAHPVFYIGATLLVVGSWIWGGVLIASARRWTRMRSLGREKRFSRTRRHLCRWRSTACWPRSSSGTWPPRVSPPKFWAC